ncbi:hypothetical protein ACJIZ3_022270 [Penstemon smallii]|uniref:Uncharacterized protein n=1 Tax=Penstemon smallii TaxID=265156 RepID=A0ABD3TKU0_9LAMI
MICLCNCSQTDRKRNHLAEESCKICGGRFIADGIDPVSAKMPPTVGLEVMNSINPELNWKTVTKGKRSRNSIARKSLNSDAKVGNSSPKSVGEFSGSDSDKFGEMGPGQLSSGKTEHVPIKKRRHLLRSPSPSLCRGDSSSKPHSSSPVSEDQAQLSYPHSSGRKSLSSYPNLQLREIDGLATDNFGKQFDNGILSKQTERKYFYSGDFSGIELLAAAASMENNADISNKEVLAGLDFSMPRGSDASNFVTPSKPSLKCSEPGNSLSEDVNGSVVLEKCDVASQSPCGIVSHETTPKCASPKVDRRHWDLNTLMDDWDVPCDDSTAGNNSKVVSDYDMHMENTKFEFSDPKSEDKLKGLTPDKSGAELSSLDKHLLNPANISLSSAGGEITNQATEKDADANNSNKVISSVTDLGSSSQAMNAATILRGSFTKLHCSSSILTSEEKKISMSGSVAILQDRVETMTQDVTKHEPAIEISASAFVVGNKDSEDSEKSFELPGTSAQDDESAVFSDSNKKFVADPTMAAWQGQFESDELVSKLEDANLPAEGLQRIKLEDSCKSNSSGAPTTSAGKVDSSVNACHDSPASQNNPGHIVDGDGLTTFQEGYDSPYEDGELRGSFLYSWEENELDKEYVDYESDGRNGDGSGSERRKLTMKVYPEDVSKSGSVKNSKNNEICGKKESHVGSGTTVEENDDIVKRRNLTDRRDADEYPSRMDRGKLQSFDATDGKDVFYMQQCRSRRLGGSYSRERNTSPERYPGRYRPAYHANERNGVDTWTNWSPRGRYTSDYQGPEFRNRNRTRTMIGDSADKFNRLDFQDQRQTANYMSKDFNRPFIRRRSPVHRDDGFSVHRRIPPTRGIGNYRGRGRHYPQQIANNREFRDDFETMPYISRREQSFSPSSGRGAHILLNRRRSRSRSRPLSPKPWHSHRQRNFGSRSSPDFRSEARIEKTRVPISKSNFESDYPEGYVSPPKGRFSNNRGFDNRNFSDDHHSRRGRSPVRGFRRNTQRFDEDFRPMIRPQRFTFMSGDDREGKFAMNYEDRKREDRSDIMHRGRQSDGSGGNNIRRFRHDDFQTSILKNEDDVLRGTESKDVHLPPAPAPAPADREDKK